MEKNIFLKQEAEAAFAKFTKNKFNFFSITKSKLKSFSRVQKEKNAFTTYNLGIIEVPLSQIVGSVQKNNDFDADFIPINSVVETRWINIYIKFLQDGNLPVIELYKIKDEYFVYDGNHRVSVAKCLNFKYIEASVIEYLPNTEKIEDLIYNEKFFFEKNTGLYDINMSETKGYSILKLEIENFILQMKIADLPYNKSALLWKKSIFNPTTKFLLATNSFPTFKNGDLFIKIVNFLKLRPNYGYLKAALEISNYPNLHVSEIIKRQIKKLEIFDEKFNKNIYILEKLIILENTVGITFKTPLKFIKEIDDYIINFDKNEKIPVTFEDFSYIFKKKINIWYNQVFIFRYHLFERKILSLPERYKKCWIYIDNPEKLNLEFISYAKIFNLKYHNEFTNMELVFNYILEVYIPLIDIIYKQENINKSYYSISYNYQMLYLHKMKHTILEAYKLTFQENSNSNFFDFINFKNNSY